VLVGFLGGVIVSSSPDAVCSLLSPAMDDIAAVVSCEWAGVVGDALCSIIWPRCVLCSLEKRKKTWLLGEFEGRWSTRRQGGEWGTDARDGARTGVSERLPSQPRGNVGTVRMDTSACRCRSDMLRSTGAR